MCRGIASPLVVIVAMCTSGFAQNPGTAKIAPRIGVNLPRDIPPQTVWMRYALYGPEGGAGRISRGETLKAETNYRYFISAVLGGTPARYARIVIYAPGCQFAAYDLDLESGSDITEQYRCESLPTRTVHGFLRPDEIPSNTYLAEKKLDITAHEDGNWVCLFFLQPRPGMTSIQAGSCLGSEVPLGTVGELDPARDGNFEIAIPDFSRDRALNKCGEPGKCGTISLTLREKKIGRNLATITPVDGPEPGLNVQDEYREPVIFSTNLHQ